MARYTGPKWRINRRENSTVLGAGEKWKRRSTAPGQFPVPRKRPSEYAIQFREKQRVKRLYGMQEKQFRRFFALAQKATGNTGTKFLQLLEMRLDSVVYKLGLAATRAQARQYITHGHLLLNGKKHNIPSTILKAGDELTISDSLMANTAYSELLTQLKAVKVPEWLERFGKGGKVNAAPTREQLDPTIKERMIIELYSK